MFDSTVVLNEIMYHPATAPEGDLEWIELFNQMAINMDISGWRLEGGVPTRFPRHGDPGRGYLVVASNPTALAAGRLQRRSGAFSDRLSNAGEEIRLVTRRATDECRRLCGSGRLARRPRRFGFQSRQTRSILLEQRGGKLDHQPATEWHAGRGQFSWRARSGPAWCSTKSRRPAAAFWLEIVQSGHDQLAIRRVFASKLRPARAVSYIFPSQTLAPGQYLTITQAQLGFSAPPPTSCISTPRGKTGCSMPVPFPTACKG